MALSSSTILATLLSVTYLIVGQSRFTSLLTPKLHARRVAAAPYIAKIAGRDDSEALMRQIGILEIGTAVLIAWPWTRTFGAVASLLLNAVGIKQIFWNGEDVGMPTWLIVGLFAGSATLIAI